ncbi:hypothetical protein LWI29_000229 [Acer saccharum]|uniref:Uncharacterized protein n=1 Tax=Acer saccharum TaxID=4024 RepID=A0AA39RKS7_ACESA|nr:hypothetical protein LWI29_000229 [Acer saccharum]
MDIEFVPEIPAERAKRLRVVDGSGVVETQTARQKSLVSKAQNGLGAVLLPKVENGYKGGKSYDDAMVEKRMKTEKVDEAGGVLSKEWKQREIDQVWLKNCTVGFLDKFFGLTGTYLRDV